MKKSFSTPKSFTLLEITIVMALTATIFSSVFLVYRSQQTQAQLETANSEIIQNLRKAQYFTLLGKDNADFGVHFEAQKYVFFKNIYSAGDSENENYEFPPTLTITNINLSGSSEIIFSSPKGLPDFPGNVVLKAVTGQSRTIKINEVGMVEWE